MAEYNPILSAPQGANKKPKRVGRGSSSGLGTTAGKGNKGQQSRSGKAGPFGAVCAAGLFFSTGSQHGSSSWRIPCGLCSWNNQYSSFEKQ